MYIFVVSSVNVCYCFPSREERSSTVDRANIGSLLSLLQQALNDLQVRTHHKQTNSIAPTTAAMSEPLATAFDNMGQTEKEGEEIGTIDKDQCQRCEPLVGEEVCGRNGKTYTSLCHAVNCAGLRESDITAGRCIDEVAIKINVYFNNKNSYVSLTQWFCFRMNAQATNVPRERSVYLCCMGLVWLFILKTV